MIKFDNLFVDTPLLDSSLSKKVSRLTGILPQSLKDKRKIYIAERRDLGKRNLYISSQRGRIFLRCPCSKNSVSCGYFVLDTMLGCPSDCSYCYLQLYQNIEAITIYENLKKRLESVKKRLAKRKTRIRLGTGEFCDSLILEDLFPQVEILYSCFKNMDSVILELKTKSDNVEPFFKIRPVRNLVISWSLNPSTIVEREERFTASLDSRIEKAKILEERGWNIGFHFDPLIYYPGWRDEYLSLIKKLKRIDSRKVRWLSLGTLRFPPALKNIILERFPSTEILSYGEFILSEGGKVRYFRKIRVEMYKYILKELRKIFNSVPVYLCMETPLVWQEVFGFIPSFKTFQRLFNLSS